MSIQEEYKLKKWTSRYYDIHNNSSSIYNKYTEKKFRLEDIANTRKMMESPRVFQQLKGIRSDMMARGSCISDDPLPDPEDVDKKEEPEVEEFIFDPKELDI